MKAPPFAYARARNLTEVFDLLEEHGDSAKIRAGGQSLMPTLNMRLSSPELLIDISRLHEHAGISIYARLKAKNSRAMLPVRRKMVDGSSTLALAQSAPLTG